MKFSLVLITLAATAAKISIVHALPQAYGTQMSYGQEPVAAQAPAAIVPETKIESVTYGQVPVTPTPAPENKIASAPAVNTQPKKPCDKNKEAPTQVVESVLPTTVESPIIVLSPTIINEQGVKKAPCGCKGKKEQPEGSNEKPDEQDDKDVDTPPSVNVESVKPDDNTTPKDVIPDNPTPVEVKEVPTVPCDKETPTPTVVVEVKANATEPCDKSDNATPPVVDVKADATEPCDKSDQTPPPVVDVKAEATEPCDEVGAQAAPTTVAEPTKTPCSQSASVQPTAAIEATPCPESGVKKIAAVPQIPTPTMTGAYEFPSMPTTTAYNNIAAQSVPGADNAYAYNADPVDNNNTAEASADALQQTSSGHKINASIMAIIAVGAGFIAL